MLIEMTHPIAGLGDVYNGVSNTWHVGQAVECNDADGKEILRCWPDSFALVVEKAAEDKPNDAVAPVGEISTASMSSRGKSARDAARAVIAKRK